MYRSFNEVCQICGEPLENCNCGHKDWYELMQEELKLEN